MIIEKQIIWMSEFTLVTYIMKLIGNYVYYVKETQTKS